MTEGVLHLCGNARAENCLFDDNSQYVAVTLVSVEGTAVLRNCSIVNTGLSSTNEGMASVDLAGKKRLNGKYIDIGCYESQSTPMIILVR